MDQNNSKSSFIKNKYLLFILREKWTSLIENQISPNPFNPQSALIDRNGKKRHTKASIYISCTKQSVTNVIFISAELMFFFR